MGPPATSEHPDALTSAPEDDLDFNDQTLVGTKGKRFGDESYPTRHGHVPDGNGIWENPHYPVKVFAVWDQTQMDELDAAGTINEVYRDTIVSYPDVASAAEGMGCAAEDLQATIDDFNSYAENGRDHAFGRTPESMRAFDGTAYYVMPMRSMILNTQGGPERNENAEVLDVNGNPIPHLYSAGEMGGFTASMYQAGTNVAECFIFGQLAGANAAASKDPLPPFDVTSPVESTPAHLGDETDLGTASAAVWALKDSAAEGELVGVGNGVGGDFAVTVTLDDAGAIASVTVGDNFETPRIGTPAIEQLPEKLIGLSTAEEIDAVDAVSGATLTSNAIKEAVKDALGL